LASLYGIPLRSLYSRNVANLFFAGRNISATHVAFASTRVMATCAIMGQAVGTAAALANQLGTRSLAEHFNAAEVFRLQQHLIRDDAFLPGIWNEDSADLARNATISASGSIDRGAPAQVTDGITRELFTPLGPWADGGAHRWEAPLPAWIELGWAAPQSVAEIHLTFDSGLQRELTLSASDHTTKKQVRGPQPELVRDYELLLDGKLVAAITDNLLRKRVHRFNEPITASRLRLVVKSTHGAPNARVFEIRAYAR
jgi:hypothetical protein